MLAECVKREWQQTATLIENENGNGGPAPKDLARRNTQKCMRATQAIERVRFLTTNRSESSVSHAAAHIMGTVARVLHVFGQLCFVRRQRKFIFAGDGGFELARFPAVTARIFASSWVGVAFRRERRS